MKDLEFRGMQDGAQVFVVSGLGSDIEAVRYAHQYASEGQLVLEKRIKGGRWKRACTFDKHPAPRRKPAKQGEAG